MKTLILGGGIVGVTTAYYLGKEGHEVTLLEEKDGLGLEATAANAGVIAPGHAFAWASPRAPGQLVRSLLGKETAIRVRLRPDPQLYAWGVKFLRECTAERARANTLIKLRLCQYSQAAMIELVRTEGIEYHAITRGALYVYRDPAELEAGARKMALLSEHGQKQEILDASAVAKLDPAFEPVKHKIAGAVRDLTDSSGDARLFTEGLARICREKLGATFQLGTRVTGLRAQGDRVTGVVTDRGELKADTYVLALGVQSPRIARTIGVKLAIYPAKGYSSTFPLKTRGLAPTLPGVDEQWLVGWSRLGDRLRLTSTAEFAGYDWGWTPRDFNNILRLARDVFPEAADYDRGEYRACLRPMTPDGRPILGPGRHRNLFLNVGHGHMGWTMAFGTARIVTDLMRGRRPEHDPAGLLPRSGAGGV
jgi:D-amino-acid dehydrogenase